MMSSVVLLLLSLLASVHGGSVYMYRDLMFEPPVDVEPPPLVPIPELMNKLGLNTAVQLIIENNLYSLLESAPQGGSTTNTIYLLLQYQGRYMFKSSMEVKIESILSVY